jgi:hypothetical protein
MCSYDSLKKLKKLKKKTKKLKKLKTLKIYIGGVFFFFKELTFKKTV